MQVRGPVANLAGQRVKEELVAATENKESWDARYARAERDQLSEPAGFLLENANLLPRSGLALDIAAGEGPNAIFLARQGLRVIALDISFVALEKCRRLAGKQGVGVEAAIVDLSGFRIPESRFDVIINFNYLQRDLASGIIRGLRPGGVLVFETLTTDHLEWKPDFNPAYLLRPGELAELFSELELIKYREANLPAGEPMRAVAGIIAKKGRR